MTASARTCESGKNMLAVSAGAKANIAILGGGLMGLTAACTLRRQGYRLKIFERDDKASSSACGFTGAGMLAPYSELESCDEVIFALGQQSADRWRKIVECTGRPVSLEQKGTVAVAHPQDYELLQDFVSRIQGKLNRLNLTELPGLSELPEMPDSPEVSDLHQGCMKHQNAATLAAQVQHLDTEQLCAIEPELSDRFRSALFIPNEGHIDNRAIMQAMEDYLGDAGVAFRYNNEVSAQANKVSTSTGDEYFDLVLDCRGLGADNLPLRGVRGELILVRAAEVKIKRMVRIMHPLHPIYIVPRAESVFLIGATSIESNDRRALTVKSALELLSAAYCSHSGFAEAEILESRVNRRPTFIDNLPRIYYQPGLIQINGLYRHGFLIAPALAELVLTIIEKGPCAIPPFYQCLIKEQSLSCR
jgi:glycine oxidase